MPEPAANWLRRQAVRMRRHKWRNAWMLADELWLILRGIDPVTTGPISINLDDLDDPSLDLPPLDDLNLPPLDLNFPELQDFGDGALPDNTDNEDGNTLTRAEVQVHWARSTVPGQVVSFDDDTGLYTVNIFPNSTQWTPSGLKFASLGADNVNYITVGGVKLLDGSLVTDDWVYVYRAAKYLITTRTVVDSATNTELSRSTEVRLDAVFHEMLLGGGGGNVFAAKIVTLPSEQDEDDEERYTLEIYPDGLSGATSEVKATQLNIADDAEIPVDSWGMVLEITPRREDSEGNVTDEGEYLMQFPVWMA